MDGPIYGACALFMAIASAMCLRLAHTRRHQAAYRVARRARVSASLSGFVVSLLTIPKVADAADALAGYDDLSTLMACLAAVIFCASLQIMIVDWTYSRAHVNGGVTLRIGMACAVIALLVWEFCRTDSNATDLTTAYAANIAVRQYLLTYFAFVAIAGSEVSVFCIRLARAAWNQRRAAATGLAFSAAGGAFCVAHAISRGGYLIAFRTGHAWPLAMDDSISPALAGLSLVCMAVGLILATTGRRIGRSDVGCEV
ncbi:hypothetical protein GCM10009753_60300 [Streptantibioticus ferralitis]